MNEVPFKHESQYNFSGVWESDFDEFGLRWPTHHLDMIFPEIIFWHTPMVATYVDRLVYEIIKKGNPVELELLTINIEKAPTELKDLNATIIGNLAFIAMHSPDANLAQLAYKRSLKIRAGLIEEVGKKLYPYSPIFNPSDNS
jgi:hypothetical protein